MPSLQVRELPEHIYLTLCRKAEAEHRSIAQQAVAMIAKAMDVGLAPQERRKAMLRTIRETTSRDAELRLPDPDLLIRKDRDR